MSKKDMSVERITKQSNLKQRILVIFYGMIMLLHKFNGQSMIHHFSPPPLPPRPKCTDRVTNEVRPLLRI